MFANHICDESPITIMYEELSKFHIKTIIQLETGKKKIDSSPQQIYRQQINF